MHVEHENMKTQGEGRGGRGGRGTKGQSGMDKKTPRGGPNGNQWIPQDSGALRPQSNPLGPMDTERYHQPQWTNDWELEHLSLVPKKSLQFINMRIPC